MPKDFSHQDLHGKSFKGQDLTGADFSHADIRGANFKGAILKGANFANAKGGLKKVYVFMQCFALIFFSTFTGALSGISGNLGVLLVEVLLKSLFNIENTLFIIFFFILYFIIVIISIKLKKFNIWNMIIMIMILMIVTFVSSVLLVLTGLGLSFVSKEMSDTVSAIFLISLFWGGFFAAVLLAGFVGAFMLSIIVTGELSLGIAIFISIGVAITTSLLAFKASLGGTIAESTALLVTIQSFIPIYITYLIYKEDMQFVTVKRIGTIFTSLGGTNLDSVNLTDANFEKTNLKYCRLSKATTILRTSFRNAENLKFARLTGTILENKVVRELLVTGNGKNQSYAGMNLKGAYLVGADLSGADFHEADLIGATFENANLRDANLSRIQALGVEFRGADLTGACLEAWNIDSTTQLDGAKADYVYLLSDKQERRPASGNFGEGEFAKLFNEVLDTVDFIFRNGIDWQAFMISFDKLREKIRIESDNAEISIQSIANKGDGVFVVKVSVPLDADKAEIHNNFRKEYDTQIKLIEEKYQAQLAGKEELITAYHHEIVHYRQQSIDMLKIIQEQPQIHITAIEKISMVHARDIKDSIVIAGDENKVN